MTTCLFIGGDHDGQRIAVTSPQKQYEIRMPVRQPLNITPSTAASATYHVQSYMRHTLQDIDGSVLYVYLCGGNVKQPLSQLIDGYRKNTVKDDE